MTGTIISHYYWKSEKGQNARYVTNGSFFFTEPDIAITAYAKLAEERSSNGMVYAEDYLYFPSEITHFDMENKKKGGIQCVRIEREWLKEYPERNITKIHLPKPVSLDYFKVSEKAPESGQLIICEGYDNKDFIVIDDDPVNFDFIIITKSEAKKIRLLRQEAKIERLETNDCIYDSMLEIEKIDVLYTSCFPNISMVGGPILDYQSNEVLGVLSHETDDPYKSDEGLRGVRMC